MKQNILYSISVILVATIVTFSYQNHESVKKSDLALENIEALSNSESSTEITSGEWIVTVYSPTHWTCSKNGGACCPGYDC